MPVPHHAVKFKVGEEDRIVYKTYTLLVTASMFQSLFYRTVNVPTGEWPTLS